MKNTYRNIYAAATTAAVAEVIEIQEFIPREMLDYNNNWLKQTNRLDSINTFILPTLSTQTKKQQHH
ncbi:unnamed protein product [Rotaria sordida]|uniref:Uncharacterized protein n=1 Tax=Rotaria sordida TaxID=392033 RepID=A0A819RZG4_9BILA|nr:unnamed protein product [Rotaria sordida]CAF0937782.1 unnamed protein product [Rotaria sordida]CAF0953469.1 unnamed protein product [Rotaria sordida]CAF1074440.1 unnamed protein product [Rotaria sordida]CAF1260325.1 unnamed protein product [Rotaria sordida]